jgi:putative ABC transport system substrate-binding protein
MSDMRRREFVTLLGGAAAAWPLATRAQQAAMPVIGFLSQRFAGEDQNLLTEFHQGLKAVGYTEGQNVAIEYRFADGQTDRLQALATDLERRQVNVVAAIGPASALAAREATTAIPIVVLSGIDLMQSGLVSSMNRPGGNLTGVMTLNIEVGPKRLELVRELVPAATTAALLVNPTRPNVSAVIADLQSAARMLGFQLHVVQAQTERGIDEAFADLVQRHIGGLVIATDVFFNSRIEQLAALSVRHAVPAIYQYREFAAAGGLMSYGSSITEMYRIVGTYVGRVLKGEKAADLPVQQSTKMELIINLKTAKALGQTVPLPLLGRADEVIE